ncbi:MAG: hypothetical protein K2M44_00080 [Clostridia bacterium]|nr:hypothetical protein [Clostridia bacterium]
MTEYEAQIDSILIAADNIEIMSEGKVAASYDKGSDKYNELVKAIASMNEGGYEMPAFGVSIHNLTIKELLKGSWLVFNYAGAQSHNGMPFDRLLLQIHPDDCGYNVIRGNDGIYDGRCFYYNLNKGNMSALYNLISTNN